jgi:hypothetical protein
VWLLVVGVAELAAVSVELAFRLLRFVACQPWALANGAVKQVRAHRRRVVEHGQRLAGRTGASS